MSPDDFSPFRKKMEAAGQPAVAIRIFRHYYELLRAGQQGKVSAAEIDPVDDVPDASAFAGYRNAGEAALTRAVVVKLNGGLGTSMGMTKAKSLLPAKEGLSFLDVIVRQTLHLRRTFGVRLPLVLMNSFRTHADSLEALAAYPDLTTDLPDDFLQHKVPRILAHDYTPVAWPQEPEHEWCPPGHGDIYAALLTSGLLDALLARGFEHMFVSNSDNLGAVLDVDLLGYVAAERVPFVMEVIDRSGADRKGGHLARLRDGRLMLREIAQCPDAELEEFQNVRRHRYFNANNLWVNLRTLRQVLERTDGVLGLPMIMNEKPVDPNDPSSPKVIQLETAMGAAISVFDGARAVRVPRARFVPVKTTGDLLALWSDVYELTDDFRIVLSARRRDPSPLVDLDGRFFRQVGDLQQRFPHGAPSLVGARRLQVRGDVRFGKGVVVEGDVSIVHAGQDPLVVADGTRLGAAT
ncbi:MAG: UTP--glucose-1-phosphate uridylyltransferase [Candidatus Binatia bacterium]